MKDEVPGLHEEEVSESQRFDVLYRAERPADLRMRDDDWKKFDTHVEPMNCYTSSMQRMGSLTGQRVLDASCGDAWSSIILAKRGATVIGFDISKVAMWTARDRAKANDVSDRCMFVAASFYALPFRDGAFHAAMGQSVLHHLHYLDVAAKELGRVLRPGAKAVFAEPFGNALWLERLRLRIPVPSGAPEEPDEWSHQFKYRDMEPFRPYFHCEIEEFQFFSRLDRVYSADWFVTAMNRLDRWLLKAVPWLRPYAREVAIEFRKVGA